MYEVTDVARLINAAARTEEISEAARQFLKVTHKGDVQQFFRGEGTTVWTRNVDEKSAASSN